MKTFTVLTQTYHQPELTEIAIKSFEKFKPDDYEIHYVVVEGSDDISYREKILSITDRVSWYNNAEADLKNPIDGASTANGMNLEYGKQFIETEWAFVCHNDVAVNSSKFFEAFEALKEDYGLFSMCKDNMRVGACHISGLFVKNEILSKVDCMPQMPQLDVGDTLTVHCRENNLPYTSIPNSHNEPDLWNQMKGIWHDVGRDCGVDRCFYDNEVIFVHLGRGIPKSLNAYYKQGKITYLGWQHIHQEYLE